MSTRVFVVIDRGMTDKTAKMIWRHEIPILEAIHGEGTVSEVDPEKLDPMPMGHYGIGEPFKTNDARDEYARLADVYGAHPEVKMSNVEYAYGRIDEGRFEAALGKNYKAIDEYDLMSTADILVQSVELGFWEPKIRSKYWSIEMLSKAALATVMKPKMTLRESLVTMMREKMNSELMAA